MLSTVYLPYILAVFDRFQKLNRKKGKSIEEEEEEESCIPTGKCLRKYIDCLLNITLSMIFSN